MTRDLILFLDSGDTLVDESTEVKIENDVVVRAELFDGAADVLRELKDEGFRIALVADGPVQSFENIYRQHELEDVFEFRAISEAVGVCKPAEAMFRTAMKGMNLTEADLPRILMLGNNLAKDVTGANRMGMISVLAGYSPRYRMKPMNAEEIPDYVLLSVRELPELAKLLDRQLKNKKTLGWL